MSNLTTISENTNLINHIKTLVDNTTKVLNISTKVNDTQSLLEFSVFDDKKLSLVQERMTEVDRATKAFCKQNSQTTSKLMSLPMLNEGPYHLLKQCLAQIERKRQALKDNTFSLQRDTNNLQRLELKKSHIQNLIAQKEHDILEMKSSDITNNPNTIREIEFELSNLKLDINDIDIEIAEIVTKIADTREYYEAAIKEIAIFQESYEEVRESNNIPVDWDEVDYEIAEIQAHVKTAFKHALRDIQMTGRLNVATIEYFEQYGINPVTGEALCNQYLEQQRIMIADQKYPNINILDQFLNEMVEVFKDAYLDVMKMRGLKTHITEWAAFSNENRNQARLPE